MGEIVFLPHSQKRFGTKVSNLSDNVLGDFVPVRQLRIVQIIAGALIIGVISFCAIVLYLVTVANQGRPFRGSD